MIQYTSEHLGSLGFRSKEFAKKQLRRMKLVLAENKPNKNAVDIEITTACNLHCPNCNRSCRQAPSSEAMTVEQIQKFVKETIKKNKKWDAIKILGGEPTLHPQLMEILDTLHEIKKREPGCIIRIVTNGKAAKTKEVLKKMPSWVEIQDTEKKDTHQKFTAYNLAPIDHPIKKFLDFKKGCWVTSDCGLGLTRYGFYPCGPGASVDRVFGFDIGKKEIPSDEDTMESQLEKLCRYCGHFMDDQSQLVTEKKISKSWQKAYEEYKRKKPELALY